jgi:hypothetical protein
MQYLLRKNFGPLRFDKQRTKFYASLLAQPENSLIFMSSKEYEKPGLKLLEPWHKVKYEVEKYSEALSQKLNNP